MDDHLPLAVGKIILAWGRLDQQLHLLIRASERRLKKEPSSEGRFTERRKIFRRLCMEVAGNDEAYERRLDRLLAQLVKLERKRGTIAHGYAGETADGGMFFNALDAMDALYGKAPEDRLVENLFTFTELAELEADIEKCRENLARIMFEAPQP